MLKFARLAPLLLATGASAPLNPLATSVKAPIQIDADGFRYGDAPPNVPAGATMALLEGTPSHPGIFTVRMKVPAGYRLPLHRHAADERVTVLSGAVRVALGTDAPKEPPRLLAAGSYYVTPAGVAHQVTADEASTLQITAIGPWTFEAVTPSR